MQGGDLYEPWFEKTEHFWDNGGKIRHGLNIDDIKKLLLTLFSVTIILLLC